MNDGHVRLLPTQVANKIAAGEVVERPASVLKELLENSLDAGASRIDIAATQGGRKLVSIRDDGCGMNRQDALMALERQATSKIRDVDDIERIDTLGFRGEAIPSIASISRFTLVTRPHDAESGTRIQVNAGTLAEAGDAGAPVGTLVEVRDLFCNVPARRKFLSSFATEEKHILRVFVTHALAHPAVGFSLTLDGRERYRLPANATLEERIRGLLGPDRISQLVPCAHSIGSVTISGYVERPNLGDTATAHDQYIFVNGRPASAAIIAQAFKNAYPRQQGDKRPCAVIFIDVPPGDVDVNVHPAKREVRFRKWVDVRAALEEAIRGAISGAVSGADASAPAMETPLAAPSPVVPSPVATAPAASLPSTEPHIVPFSSAPAAAPFFSAPLPLAPEAASTAAAPVNLPDASPSAAALEPNAITAENPDSPWRTFRFLAFNERGFIIVETDAGIVIVNPKAAYERVVFEKLMASAKPMTQPLLIPRTVRLGPCESARIRSYLDAIAANGFQIEEFGADTWKIDAEPQPLGDGDPAEALLSIATDLETAGTRRGGERWREEAVARSVARHCAGARTKLTPDAAVALLRELAAAKMPYVSPRGKPTMIFYSNREIERKFGL